MDNGDNEMLLLVMMMAIMIQGYKDIYLPVALK